MGARSSVTVVTSRWTDTAAEYDASFAQLCAGAIDSLLEGLHDQPAGARLLDVGTGTGAVAAAAVAHGWHVDGVDVEQSMIDVARRKVPDATFVVADVLRLPWPDEQFGAVTANFVLNHVADPRAALREIHRVCVPGGRFCATIWPSGVSPINALWNTVGDQGGARALENVRLPSAADFARTLEGMGALLTEGGFEQVDARAVAWTFVIEPAELWRGVEAEGSPSSVRPTWLKNDPYEFECEKPSTSSGSSSRSKAGSI